MKYLYKYPQGEFPYDRLVEENRRRGRSAPEFELIDTGIFDEDRYFDVVVEYAKADIDDILIRLSVTNRGPEAAECHLLPTLWFRNTWSWEAGSPRPRLAAERRGGHRGASTSPSASAGSAWRASPELLFTENETNFERLFREPNRTPYVKDGIDAYVVRGRAEAVNPAREGTKAAARYRLRIGPGETASVRLRLANVPPHGRPLGPEFDALFAQRQREADRVLRQADPGHAGRRRARDPPPGRRRACSGASSSTTTTSGGGSRAIRPTRLRHRSGATAATTSGRTSTTRTSSRCRTSGNTRGTRRGTSPSTAARSRSSIPTSPRSSSSCSCASGTCTRTDRFRPTSGRSATSTPRCTRGPRGACTRSTSGVAGSGIAASWSGSSTSCCSTSPGG